MEKRRRTAVSEITRRACKISDCSVGEYVRYAREWVRNVRRSVEWRSIEDHDDVIALIKIIDCTYLRLIRALSAADRSGPSRRILLARINRVEDRMSPHLEMLGLPEPPRRPNHPEVMEKAGDVSAVAGL